MNYFLKLCCALCSLLITVNGQTCPDGFPAVFKCTASKKHTGGYYCKDDEKLSCEFINGISYCCDREKDGGDSAEGSAVTKKSTTEHTGNETESTKKTHNILTTTLASKKTKVDKNDKKSSNREEEERPKKKTKPKNKKPEPSSSSCFDQGTECRFRTQLCTNPLYEALMRDQCPLTCKLCDPEDETSFETKNKTENEDEDDTDKKYRGSCEDHGPDCSRLPELCNNPFYIDFMQKECPLTCNVC